MMFAQLRILTLPLQGQGRHQPPPRVTVIVVIFIFFLRVIFGSLSEAAFAYRVWRNFVRFVGSLKPAIAQDVSQANLFGLYLVEHLQNPGNEVSG